MFENRFSKELLNYQESDINFIRDIINDTWALDRSHVTDGYDESVKRLARHIDIEVEDYPSGKDYGMWTIPPKWTVRKGSLKDSNGKILADYERHPLELWCYSDSYQGTVTREELAPHIWTHPKRPNDISMYPRLQYRHWEKNWGFSLPHNVWKALSEGNYEVDIQTEFSESTMKTMDYAAPGKSDRMIVLSGHWDHPYQCNDGLVGSVVALDVIRRLRQHKSLKFNYHAILTVEFIGSTAWLHSNEERAAKVDQGLFVAMMGNDNTFALQRSFKADSELERIIHLLLKFKGSSFREAPCNQIVSNDEKSFDSPGFNISMASISRCPFSEYHTDKDNPDSLLDDKMIEGSDLIYETILAFENNFYPKALFKGLPCLSKPEYNLYFPPTTLGQVRTDDQVKKAADKYGGLPDNCTTDLHFFMNTVVHYLDGKHSILDIAETFDLPFYFVLNYFKAWDEKGIAVALEEPPT